MYLTHCERDYAAMNFVWQSYFATGKQAGLNVSGVVAQATADKLALKSPQPQPGPAKN
ncbi:MAG: hypothetical protein WB697_10665 [Stellaceae bacterium]